MFQAPPPEEFCRANSETCDVTQDLQKERGKSHIKVVKLDPPLSESDRSGFLIDDVDMGFALFFCVKTFLTETDDFVGEGKAARLAVGPRYNGAGLEIVCTPPLLTL